MKIVADAIGPDLRFTSATVNQAKRHEPAKPDTTISGLVGDPSSRGYSEEPI